MKDIICFVIWDIFRIFYRFFMNIMKKWFVIMLSLLLKVYNIVILLRKTVFMYKGITNVWKSIKWCFIFRLKLMCYI